MLDPLADLMKSVVEVLLVLARRMPEDRVFPAFLVLTVSFTLIARDLITASVDRLHASGRTTDDDSDMPTTPRQTSITPHEHSHHTSQDSNHDNSQDQESTPHEHSKENPEEEKRKEEKR